MENYYFEISRVKQKHKNQVLEEILFSIELNKSHPNSNFGEKAKKAISLIKKGIDISHISIPNECIKYLKNDKNVIKSYLI